MKFQRANSRYVAKRAARNCVTFGRREITENMISPVVIVCGIVSGVLILNLWIRHAHDTIWKKVFWLIILLIPIVGWLFYGAFYNPPTGQGPGEQAEGNASGWYYTGFR